MLALLFLPKGVAPPYQVVFMWPGGSGVQYPSSDTPQTAMLFDFIVKSGRAVMFPVLKSTYERRDGLDVTGTIPDETAAYRDRVIVWVKEVRRSIDYLETRPGVFDVSKLAYFGHSWGGRMAGQDSVNGHQMVAFRMRHRSNKSELVSPCRESCKMFANLYAWNVCMNRLKLAPDSIGSVRLHVERIVLTKPST